MCVHDEHRLAGRDIQYRAADNRSRYTTPFNRIKSIVQHLNNPGIPMILVIQKVKSSVTKWHLVTKHFTIVANRMVQTIQLATI